MLDKLRLRFRRVKDDLAGRRIDSVIGRFSFEQVIGEGNPLCLFVLVGAVYVGGDVKITRFAVRIFAV